VAAPGDDGRRIFERAGVKISPRWRGTGCLRRSSSQRPEAEGSAGSPPAPRWCCNPTATPYCPTVHLKLPLLRSGRSWWFGAGLTTPFLSFLDDAIHFHSHLEGSLFDGINPAY